MKIREYRKGLKELGFNLYEAEDHYWVDNVVYQTLLDVGKEIPFTLDTRYPAFYELIDDEPEIAKKLFLLTIDFAETLPDERKDERKYYLKSKWLVKENEIDEIKDKFDVRLEDFEFVEVEDEL